MDRHRRGRIKAEPLTLIITGGREESMQSSAGSYRHRQVGEERKEEAILRRFPLPQAAKESGRMH